VPLPKTDWASDGAFFYVPYVSTDLGLPKGREVTLPPASIRARLQGRVTLCSMRYERLQQA